MEAITIKDIFQELKSIKKEMITKRDLNRLAETLEILSNKETMEQIEKSERDIELGRVKKVNSVRDLF